MKYIFCKSCGKRFFVAELGRGKVSLAEAEGLCGQCYAKQNRHESVKGLLIRKEA